MLRYSEVVMDNRTALSTIITTKVTENCWAEINLRAKYRAGLAYAAMWEYFSSFLHYMVYMRGEK